MQDKMQSLRLSTNRRAHWCDELFNQIFTSFDSVIQESDSSGLGICNFDGTKDKLPNDVLHIMILDWKSGLLEFTF